MDAETIQAAFALGEEAARDVRAAAGALMPRF
jgi:hypothetical protein